jgi:hypothetical protein
MELPSAIVWGGTGVEEYGKVRSRNCEKGLAKMSRLEVEKSVKDGTYTGLACKRGRKDGNRSRGDL